MLKSLLGLLVGLFTAGCGWGQAQAKDKFFWTRKHISFVEQQPIWKNSEAEVHAYFGFDYRNFNDTFQEYHGDPLGPVVGIWKTEQYFGEKPNFKNCGEEPKYSQALEKYRINTPDYELAEEAYRKERKKYYDCRHTYETIKEKSKTIKYYYARSLNNHKPILPEKADGHALYEAHMTFGPLGGIPAG